MKKSFMIMMVAAMLTTSFASMATAGDYCSKDEYCFEVIEVKWEDSSSKEIYIKCTDGPRAYSNSKECISQSKSTGKWADGCVTGSYSYDFKAAGNWACGVY